MIIDNNTKQKKPKKTKPGTTVIEGGMRADKEARSKAEVPVKYSASYELLISIWQNPLLVNTAGSARPFLDSQVSNPIASSLLSKANTSVYLYLLTYFFGDTSKGLPKFFPEFRERKRFVYMNLAVSHGRYI